MKKFLVSAVALLSFSVALLAQDLTGNWQGTLKAGDKSLRVVIKISKAELERGDLKAVLYSIDQGGQAIPLGAVTLQGSIVKIPVPALAGGFEGRLNADGTSIAGNWTQGGGTPVPLNLLRAAGPAAWTIPDQLPAVVDRPVVDQTGLSGKWDFTLKWTPDESQFAGMGVRVPAPADDAAPPDLYTAIQQQLGLKLESTKASTEFFVVERVEKPSEN